MNTENSVAPASPSEAMRALSQTGVRYADALLDAWRKGEDSTLSLLAPYPLPKNASEIEESAVITAVEPNPKHVDSAAHARYAVYRVGMTVAEYVDLCSLKFGGRLRSTYLGDLLWDMKRSYVKLGTPGRQR